MSMPGAIESSKRYESLDSFHKDEVRMIARGWTTRAVRSIKVDGTFLQRIFHRHAATQVDVRYQRPDWPDN